ncbi:MAG: VWA domain-containing protein [Chloroflexota bacterium]|nr:MAG: VWA domain-containing protein [Chloroflexota bacterium]
MRTLYRFIQRNEQGQSALVIVAGLVALIGALALAVDGGNAYAQRRQLQNAMDAGAQAGAIQLSLNKTNGEIDDKINEYVARNGADPARVNSYYVTQDSSGIKYVEHGSIISAYGVNSPPPSFINGRPIFGVQVEGTKQFPTFFAGVVGWRQLQVGADSRNYASPPTRQGTCQAETLFPIALSANTFTDENKDGIVDFHFSNNEPTYAYRIWEKKPTELANFGYVSWNGSTSASNVANFMNNAGLNVSGRWSKGDNIPYAPGDLSSGSIRNALQGKLTSGDGVTVPVYDYANQSNNAISSYRIIGFARMTIVALSASGLPAGQRYMDVRFVQWVEPTGGGACPYYGVGQVAPPPPQTPGGPVTRNLVGTIKISKINPVGETTQTQTHVPVDVMNVMDISGSMNAGFGSMSKISAARTALVNFNNNMQPLLGDKVGLATYPQIVGNLNGGGTYSFNCQQNGQTSQYYIGQLRSTLTSNIAGVNAIINGLNANGGTPIAGGLQQGRLAALGAGHNPANPAVIILASDGLANIRLNGRWTGFDGDTYNSLQCNVGAVQDALDQANLAKGDGNSDGRPDTIIFTIAVGNDFNPDLMQALATVDTDPNKPHYFRVTDATSMNNIYQQIANRVQNFQNESCQVIQTEAFAPGATLVVRNRDTGQQYTVNTTSTGEFVINNVSPGTFEFVSASVNVNGFTYDVFTNGVGGPALASNPTVTVGQGGGTYKTDLFLKTTDSVSCPGS